MKIFEIAPADAPIPAATQLVPDQLKRERMRNQLAMQTAASSNDVQPTTDDLAIAFSRYCQAQNAVNRQYEKSLPAQTSRKYRTTKSINPAYSAGRIPIAKVS